VSLTSVGDGLPTGATTAPLRYGAGERLELRPKSWKDLARGVRLTVRNRSGRVIRRGMAPLKATRSAIGGVAARVSRSRGNTRVTVTGRVTRRGAAPVLGATAQVMIGGRVVKTVASKALRGAAARSARFSLPVSLGKVKRRARVRVTVQLLDEAAGLAGARRQVTVRG
jgi:hypothetical protein